MRISWAIVAISCALLLSGCSDVPVVTTNGTSSVPGAALQGEVHGGQQPISGAHVYLYAINNTGYGSPSVSLLSSATGNPPDGNGNYYVITDSNGDFTITGDYNCLSGTPLTYVYAVGGSAGSGANSAAGLIAGVGDCTHSGYTSKFVVVNEVSTIASAYGAAGFIVDPTHVSTSSTTLGATGLTNAANTVGNLYTQNTGVALATTPAANGGNGTVPQSEINTLANILAACINSSGAVTGGASPTPCYTLFTNALSGGTTGTQPTNTAMAAINIAHNPWANIAALYALQTANSPFQPTLSAAPNDFTIAVSYTGAGMNGPLPVAIDASGNVWLGNTNSGANSVSELSPIGAPITGSPFSGGGIVDPYSIAIDSSGNVWTGNVTPDSLSELSSTGSPVSTSSGYTGGGLNAPYAIAFDSLGHAWVVNNVGSSLSEFSSTGSPVTTSPGDQGGGINNDPVSLAIDASGNIWVSDSITLGALSEFYSSGASAGMPISPSTGDTGGGLADPWGLAVDASGNVWVADSSTGANRISEFDSSGMPVSGSSGFTGGGLNFPEGIAIDGVGNVWVVNRGSNQTMPPYPDSSISEFNSSGTAISPSTGYQAGLNLSLRIAVDGSGNVWVPNASLNSVTEFVGAGSPVVTPIVANLLAPYGAQAVNKP